MGNSLYNPPDNVTPEGYTSFGTDSKQLGTFGGGPTMGANSDDAMEECAHAENIVFRADMHIRGGPDNDWKSCDGTLNTGTQNFGSRTYWNFDGKLSRVVTKKETPNCTETMISDGLEVTEDICACKDGCCPVHVNMVGIEAWVTRPNGEEEHMGQEIIDKCDPSPEAIMAFRKLADEIHETMKRAIVHVYLNIATQNERRKCCQADESLSVRKQKEQILKCKRQVYGGYNIKDLNVPTHIARMFTDEKAKVLTGDFEMEWKTPSTRENAPMVGDDGDESTGEVCMRGSGNDWEPFSMEEYTSSYCQLPERFPGLVKTLMGAMGSISKKKLCSLTSIPVPLLIKKGDDGQGQMALWLYKNFGIEGAWVTVCTTDCPKTPQILVRLLINIITQLEDPAILC